MKISLNQMKHTSRYHHFFSCGQKLKQECKWVKASSSLNFIDKTHVPVVKSKVEDGVHVFGMYIWTTFQMYLEIILDTVYTSSKQQIFSGKDNMWYDCQY